MKIKLIYAKKKIKNASRLCSDHYCTFLMNHRTLVGIVNEFIEKYLNSFMKRATNCILMPYCIMRI